MLCRLDIIFYLLTYFLDRSRESTVFLQVNRSFIMAASSPDVDVPVSLFSWSTYVALGRPLPRWPWVGSHRTRRWAPSSGWRWQCPASRSLLAAILSLSFGRLPYSVTFGILSLQWTLRAFLSILVYEASSAFSIAFVSIHAIPGSERCQCAL